MCPSLPSSCTVGGGWQGASARGSSETSWQEGTATPPAEEVLVVVVVVVVIIIIIVVVLVVLGVIKQLLRTAPPQAACGATAEGAEAVTWARDAR